MKKQQPLCETHRARPRRKPSRVSKFSDWMSTRKEVEVLISRLRTSGPKGQSRKENVQINIPKLLARLHESKQKLERKISNKILLEANGLKLKFRRS